MKKYVDRFKKQVFPEGLNLAIGTAAGAIGLAVTNKAKNTTSDSAIVEGLAKFGTPVAFALLGWLLTSITEDKRLKAAGYGFGIAGSIGIIGLTAAGKEMLSGLGDTDIPASEFYNESEEQKRDEIMAGFGLNALPLASAGLQSAAPSDMDLPELEGMGSSDTPEEENLSFNAAQTGDADDLSGIV